MNAARSFRDLRVYRDAFRVAQRVFALSQTWPKVERYSLTDQIRRSSRAVCANLAEAWHKRPYPRHFASKLTDAEAEAGETKAWLDFAVASGYLERSAYEALDADCDRVIGGLVKMRTNPAPWCGPSHVREPEAGYAAGPFSPAPMPPSSPAP